MSLDSQVAIAPLRIQFLCHPKGSARCYGTCFCVTIAAPVISSDGKRRYESHSFVKTVKGSREISQQIAACRPPRPHRVSYRLAVSSTSSPLRGSLLHRKASHVVFRLLTLPCKPRSLAPPRRRRGFTCFPFRLPLVILYRSGGKRKAESEPLVSKYRSAEIVRCAATLGERRTDSRHFPNPQSPIPILHSPLLPSWYNIDRDPQNFLSRRLS